MDRDGYVVMAGKPKANFHPPLLDRTVLGGPLERCSLMPVILVGFGGSTSIPPIVEHLLFSGRPGEEHLYQFESAMIYQYFLYTCDHKKHLTQSLYLYPIV